jgi:hypothetical protein
MLALDADDERDDAAGDGLDGGPGASVHEFLVHSMREGEMEDEVSGAGKAKGGLNSVATNMADDGRHAVFQKHLAYLGAKTGLSEEQYNDPEWRAHNLLPGTELVFPVQEVMEQMPRLTRQEMALVELYNIVANNCVNLRTFDAIVKLIQREMLSGGFHKDERMPSRKTFVERLKKKFPCTAPESQRLDPESVDHGIPNASGVIARPHRVKYDVVTVFFWNAQQTIIESLACPRMYGDLGNLIVNKDDPFAKYVPHSSMNEIGTEIISGKVYQDTYNRLIKDPDKEHLAVYTAYLDKASSGDAQQRYNAEPVTIVCSYLKRLFRNMVKNWIILGFIPDLELGSSAKKQKTRNTSRGSVSKGVNFIVTQA